jgi:hypothetical protein
MLTYSPSTTEITVTISLFEDNTRNSFSLKAKEVPAAAAFFQKGASSLYPVQLGYNTRSDAGSFLIPLY